MSVPTGALEWLSEADNSLAKQSRRARLKDLSSSLLDQYAELLRSGQVHDDVRQQVGELRTSVLAAGIVQAADNMMQLTDELQCASTIGDHQQIGREVDSVVCVHTQFAEDGSHHLQRVAREMHAALRELEESYYNVR